MRPTRSQKFYPPPAKTALELSLTHRGRIDCRYQYPDDLGTGYATSGLGSYIQPAYDTARIIVPTATMANRTVVTIPFHFQKSIKHSWWWNGNVDWEASATGSLTPHPLQALPLDAAKPHWGLLRAVGRPAPHTHEAARHRVRLRASRCRVCSPSVRLARVLGQPQDRRARRHQEADRDEQRVIGRPDERGRVVAGAQRVEQDRAHDGDPERHRQLLH
jgi:hypothetical protein